MEDRRNYQGYWQNLNPKQERRSPVIKYYETAEYQEILKMQAERDKRCNEQLKEVLDKIEALKVNVTAIVREQEEAKEKERQIKRKLAEQLARDQSNQHVADTIVNKRNKDDGRDR